MNNIKKLQTMFKDKFQIEIDEKYFLQSISISLNGIGLNALEMYYLIHFIEKEFTIKFTPEHIKSGSIRTLQGLCSTIKELQKTEVFEKV